MFEPTKYSDLVQPADGEYETEEEKLQAQLESFQERGEESDEETDEEEEAKKKTVENALAMLKKITEKKQTHPGAMFDPQEPGTGYLYVSVGKSGRGKTHWVVWLLTCMLHRPISPLKFGLVFVKTKYKHSYKFIPEKAIIQGYNELVLRRYILNLEREYEKTGWVAPNFIVFEDLTGILNNQTDWFTNWLATFRHLNTSIFINSQYLTGRKAISPITREQTNFAFMFNSKTRRTIENLWESYGQLFPTVKEFKQYFFENTEPSKVGPHVCLVYSEFEDQLEKNYIPMRAPEKYDTPDVYF